MTKELLDKVLLTEDLLNEKQFASLQDMIQTYKELQEELYDFPGPDTLFTKTQQEIFQIFDIE